MCLRVKRCCFCVTELDKACFIICAVYLALATVGTVFSALRLEPYYAVAGVILIGLHLVLLRGTETHRTDLLLVYVIAYSTLSVLQLLGGIASIVFRAYAPSAQDEIKLLVTGGVSIGLFPINVHIANVVYSFRKELKESRNRNVV